MVIAGTTARSLWVPLLPKNVSLIRFLFGVDTLVHQKRLWAGFSLFQNRIQHGPAYRYDGGRHLSYEIGIGPVGLDGICQRSEKSRDTRHAAVDLLDRTGDAAANEETPFQFQQQRRR